MLTCPKCGKSYNTGDAFCEDCGFAFLKKCIKCNAELSLTAKFCKKCGTPQDGSVSPSTGVSMGDKNVIAGDVLGQKIMGDNVANKILGNATFNTIQDDTKRVNTCAICGKHMTNDEGHTCPNCGKVVCIDHFDIKKCLCLACAKAEHSKKIEEYRKFLLEITAKGKIGKQEEEHLKEKRKILELTENDVLAVNREFLKYHTSFVVSADGTGDFKKIGDALKYAEDGTTITIKIGEYREHFTIDKAVTICGERNGEKIPVIGDVFENTDVCININAKATLKNLKVISFDENFDHDSLDYSNDRFYSAINITEDAVLENVIAEGWFDDGFRICGEGVNPTIKRCSAIKNGGYGLVLKNGAIGFIRDCIFGENKKIGVAIYADAMGHIENCDIFGNERSGIAIHGSNTNPTIKGCKIHNGKKDGVWIMTGAQGTVENCDIFGNNHSGIVINDANTNPTIKGCKIHDGKQAGVWIFAGAQGTVENCDIFGNEYSEIAFEDANTNPVIKDCKIHDGKHYGLLIRTKAKGAIENCDIFENKCPGIIITGSNTNPIIKNCKIHDGKHYGVCVQAEAQGSIENCDIFGNNDSGININDANTNPIIKGCKIHDGKQNGVWVHTKALGIIENCDIFENEYNEIIIADANTNPVIKGCKIHDGKQNGVWVHTKALGIIENCDIFGNESDGIAIVDANTNPVIKGSRIHDGKRNGIWVQAEAQGTIKNCNIFRNNKADILNQNDKLDPSSFKIRAPIAGDLLKLHVKVGDEIYPKQEIAIVTVFIGKLCIKKEPVISPYYGTVASILCNEGDDVRKEQILITLQKDSTNTL